MSRRASLLARLLAAVVVVLPGCVSENRPESCDEDAVVIEITVRGDGIDGDPLAACRGQAVIIDISPKVDGTFHIHGYDHLLPATPIAAGEQLELSFTADRAGQFPIELHPTDDPRGVSIGILTVHER